MKDLQRKLEYVRDKIEGKLNHPFLAQYIEAPKIDEDKLLFLVSILDYVNIPEAEMEHYAVPTMLLQIALDTHETVTNEMTGVNNLKNRQLTVLAGVYYSGLYYKILADQNDIDVIRILAEGIETINDHKILVYQKEIESIDKLMGSLSNIESSLYNRLASYLDANEWEELISHFLFIKRLFTEREQFRNTNSSVVFEALKKLVFPKQENSLKELSHEQKNYLILICDRYINFSKQLLLKSKDNIPLLNSAVDNRIRNLIKLHQPIAKSLVEEG